MSLHIVLHVDVKNQAQAISIAEQLSNQAIGFALAGHGTMISIDNEVIYEGDGE